jgi:hypothetical protein
MAWPWRRERGRHAAVAPRRMAAVVQSVAVQPTDTPPVDTPQFDVPQATEPSTERATDAGVRLGFADGTEVELGAGDPRALALRAVADVLVAGPHG